MKLKLFIGFLVVLFTHYAHAQLGINYKALVKDGSGVAVASQTITVQFKILQGAGQVNVYEETHTPTTSIDGVINIVIGKGVPISGVFANIDWGADDHFLNVQIDIGDGLEDMGTTQFMAVPYALNIGKESISINDLIDGYSALGNVGIGSGSLVFNTTGYDNTASGYSSLYENTTGRGNTANGNNTLKANSTGSYNTAIGAEALTFNKLSYNTALGNGALHENTFGEKNTAAGVDALAGNILGIENTASGYRSLYLNTIGNYNTASGTKALSYNSEGNNNTANGYEALINNMKGNNNTASGFSALRGNTDGDYNTANGASALLISQGDYNTANGFESLRFNNPGDYNSANGYRSLYNNSSGGHNTAIGSNALINNSTGNNNTGIGNGALVPDGTLDNQVQVGNSSITYAGVQVAWTVTSDKRWKENIRVLPYGLDVVMQLKPVDYVRKNNEHKTREMGFIAQDVEGLLNKIGYKDQGFLHKDSKGFMSIRYNDLIALLTKAIQEQQEIIGNQSNEIKSLSADLDKRLNNQKSFETRLKEVETILKTNQQ